MATTAVQNPPAWEIEGRSIDWVPEGERHWLVSRSMDITAEGSAIEASEQRLTSVG